MGSVFQERETPPTDETIRAALRAHPDAWAQLEALLHSKEAVVSWRYSRDGGWLAKATLGKKTIAWLAVEDGFVRITFYFAERHRDTLRTLPGLPAMTQERIAVTPMSGKLLPVTFEVRTANDVNIAGSVLSGKLTAK